MSLQCLLLVLSVATICVGVADSSRFHGHKLLSVLARTEDGAKFLHSLKRDYIELDFWTDPHLDRPCTVLVPPHLLAVVQDAMTRNGIVWKERDADVSKLVQESMRKSPSSNHRQARSAEQSSKDQDIVDHNNYHSYDDIVSYLEKFQKTYPDNVNVSKLRFPTHEGRSVALIKLTGAPISSNKPSIIMESGIHAREWISPAATLYSIEKTLQQYHARDPVARSMLDWFDWYIVPSTNPDGYQYTRTGEDQRLWRKNRRMIHWNCSGVDLNRNFDVYFGTTGVSDNCSSLIYPGKGAFSEPETANIKHLFNSLNESIIAYLSVHSYSQFVLVPWSFSNVGLMPDNKEELTSIGEAMAGAIKDTHGKIYKVGTAYDLLEYAASGSSKDWAIYTKPNIYAFTYELRPKYDSDVGFLLPPNEIIPTGQEFLASLRVLAQRMRHHGDKNKTANNY